MTEAVKELVYLSFEKFQLKELKIVTHVENAGSQKVALKAGFRLFRQFKGVTAIRVKCAIIMISA